MKNWESIRKWLDNALTDEERTAFEHTDDFRFVNQLSDALQQFKAPEYPVEDELERLHTKRAVQEDIAGSKTRWLIPLLKVAAVLLLVAGFSYWFLAGEFFTQRLTHISSSDQKETYLPDASLVVLNKQSSISYHQDKWSEKRDVLLDGEAYFEVERGAQFDVITDFGKVSVLGTRFNVKERQNYFEVTCYEGEVAVQVNKERIILTAGQQFRIINGKMLQRKTADQSSPSWTNNISTFASVPVIEVLREFERQYEVTFRYNELDTARLFTGSFTHANRVVALKSITVPLSLNYRVEQDKIILME